MYELAMVTDIMHQTPFESLCAKVSEPPSPTYVVFDRVKLRSCNRNVKFRRPVGGDMYIDVFVAIVIILSGVAIFDGKGELASVKISYILLLKKARSTWCCFQ